MTDQDRPGNTEQAPSAQDGLEDGPVFERRFWSTVRFPPAELLGVVVVVALIFLGAACITLSPEVGILVFVVVVPVTVALWAPFRVFRAWLEWRSRWRWLNWLKAVLRFFLLGDSPPR
jgi:hypothetical protein